MADKVLIEGDNQLNVGLTPIPPRFGYGEWGALKDTSFLILPPNYRYEGSHFTCPETGVIESITFWGEDLGTSGEAKACIYDYETGQLVGCSPVQPDYFPMGKMTIGFVDGPIVLKNKEYWLILVSGQGAGGTAMYYDNDIPGKGTSFKFGESLDEDSLPKALKSRKYSIYCNYTAIQM